MIDDDELKARFAHLVEVMGENYEPRDSAVELVRSRDILPAEADRLALLFGWYPFTIKPTGRKYDPMEAVYWTPAMVLSWIANRSIAPETGPDWRRDAYRWRDIPRFGWDVVGYDPLTLTGFRQEAILRAAAGGAQDEPEKLDLAMEDLLRACRRGELGMSAHDPSTGIRRAPTRLEWQDMDFAEDGNRDVLRSPVGLWSSPTAEAEVVMTLWPALPVEAAPSDDEPEIAEDERREDEPEALPIIEAWPEVEDKASDIANDYNAAATLDYVAADEPTPTPLAGGLVAARPPRKHRGAESLAEPDAPFVKLMRELVLANKCTVNAAAGIVLADNRDKIRRQPRADDESVIRRLRERYKATHREDGE